MRELLPPHLYDDGFWDDALDADKTAPGSIRHVRHPDDPDSRDVYVYNANQETLPDEYSLAEFRVTDFGDGREMYRIAERAVADSKHQFPLHCVHIATYVRDKRILTHLIPYERMPVLCAVLP